MMKHYFYSPNGDDKLGPFSLKELSEKKIFSHYLIWFEGLGQWKEASEIPELSSIVVHSPPPLPNADKKKETRKRKSYIPFTNAAKEHPFKEDGPLGYGIALGVFLLVTVLLGYNSKEGGRIAIFVFWFAIRIATAIYLFIVSKKLRRQPALWGLFGFFSPVLASIIMGTLESKPYNVDESLDDLALYKEAEWLFENDQYFDCIRCVQELISRQGYNERLIVFMSLCHFGVGDFERARKYLVQHTEFTKRLGATYFSIGICFYYEEALDKAKHEWDKAVKAGFEPDSSQTYLMQRDVVDSSRYYELPVVNGLP